MKKILILFGGNSTEHYVSCKSAYSILENIDKNLFDVTCVGLDLNNEWYIYKDNISYLNNGEWINKNVIKIDNIIKFLKQFDTVFSIIHGNTGEDGKLQSLLELFNIKYIGSNSLTSAICFDKGFTKMIAENNNIPQTKYIIVDNNFNIKDIELKLNYPLIIKPANGGSSIGITKANNKKELLYSINNAKKYDKKIIIEEFIKARELEIAVLYDKKFIISKPGEIISGNEWYDYNAKYSNNKSKTIIPNDIPKNIEKKLMEYTKKIINIFDIKGLARIDFFYNYDKQEVLLNEINTLPGFTTISMYPQLLKNKKIDYKSLITKLIINA